MRQILYERRWEAERLSMVVEPQPGESDAAALARTALEVEELFQAGRDLAKAARKAKAKAKAADAPASDATAAGEHPGRERKAGKAPR